MNHRHNDNEHIAPTIDPVVLSAGIMVAGFALAGCVVHGIIVGLTFKLMMIWVGVFVLGLVGIVVPLARQTTVEPGLRDSTAQRSTVRDSAGALPSFELLDDAEE